MKIWKTNKFKIIFTCFILILFKNFFEILLTTTVVDYFLKYCVSFWLDDVLVIGISILIIYYFFKNKRSFIFSISALPILLLITGFYIFYRIKSHPWVFTEFSFYHPLKYFDVFEIIVLLNIYRQLKYLFEKEDQHETQTNTFYSDESLGKEGKDEFGYDSYAKEVALKIENSKFQNSFAIGINGKWGTGKTSFIDLLKRNLDQEKNILIDFNPWRSSSPEQIIKDFFDSIRSKIAPINSKISRDITNYSEKLSSLEGGAFISILKFISFGLINSKNSVADLYDEINHELPDIGKKIIIFIDDLDRLDKKEILEVIKLIRNTANFYNTFFVVAYDRNYILKAIEEHNPSNHELFLEKIFQLEISLPYFDGKILTQKLIAMLLQSFPEEYHEEIKGTFSDTISRKPSLGIVLKSLRDVSRLANSLSLNLKGLMNEVVLTEFINLELLRLKFPSVYELIFRDRNVFLDTKENGRQKHIYILRKVGSDKNNSAYSEYKAPVIKEFLEKNASSLSISDEQVPIALSILSSLFEDNIWGYHRNTDFLSIIYPSNFNKYFSYGLGSGDLSEMEFSTARKEGLESLKKKIDDWVKRKLELDIRGRFEAIKDFDDKEDFENIIEAIFYLANKESQLNFRFWNIVGYESRELMNKVYDSGNSISKKFYPTKDGKNELKDFILKQFSKAKSPFDFESQLAHEWLVTYSGEDFILPRIEMEKIVIQYFSHYLMSKDKIDRNFWGLFHNCKIKEWTPGNGGTVTSIEKHLDEAKEIFKKFILEKDLHGFLQNAIQPESFDRKGFAIHEIVYNIFGTMEDFENSISKLNNPPKDYLVEFLEFYNLCKKVNFKQWVPFDFKFFSFKQSE